MKKVVCIACCLCMVFLFLGCKDDNNIDEKVLFNLIAMKDDKYGVINQDGDEVLPLTFNELSNPSKDGVMVSRYFNNLYELINLEGEPVVSSFSELTPLYDQSMEGYTLRTPYAFFGIKNGVAALYDSKGEHFMNTESIVGVYDHKVYTQKGYFRLNELSKELVDHYDSIFQLSDEGYFVLKDTTIYVLNSDGEVEYDYLNYTMTVMQNFIKITNGILTFLFDFDGNRIYSSPRLYEASQIQDKAYILIQERDKCGVIDLEGNLIVPIEYMSIKYDNNLFIAKKAYGDFNSFDLYHHDQYLKTFKELAANRNFGFNNDIFLVYDKFYIKSEFFIEEGYFYYKDNNVASGPYKAAEPFNEKGYATIMDNSDINSIINDAFEIVDSSYRYYIPFGNYFLVESKSQNSKYRWGILDTNLDVIVPLKYELLSNYRYSFTQTISLLEEETTIKHYYVLNDEGYLKYLYDLPFKEAITYINEIFSYSYEEDYVGNLMKIKTLDLPEGYEIIDIIAKDYMIATLDDKYGVLDNNYKVVIPFDYDLIIGNEGLYQ